jgi:dCMP deaminase
MRTDLDYIKMAYQMGRSYSTDPSTQNGSVIVNSFGSVVSAGANHFPNGVADDDTTKSRWERPIKYSYVEHAERNAIYKAAKCGLSTNGCTMYCYWAACVDCARAIIQSGIKTLVRHKIIMDVGYDRWKETIELADQMMHEAGIIINQIEDPIEDIQIRFNGNLWTPNGKC